MIVVDDIIMDFILWDIEIELLLFLNYLYLVIATQELVVLVIDWWLVDPFQLS